MALKFIMSGLVAKRPGIRKNRKDYIPVDTKNKLTIDILTKEYDKLKSEQSQRIGYRDNLTYATFIATAAIMTVALKFDGNKYSLLALPYICFALGCSHSNNDRKITALGKYISNTLRLRIASIIGHNDWIFAWESDVRTRQHRRIDKLLSFIANLITFICPGAAAICAFQYLHPKLNSISAALINGGWAVLGILLIALIWASDIFVKFKA